MQRSGLQQVQLRPAGDTPSRCGGRRRQQEQLGPRLQPRLARERWQRLPPRPEAVVARVAAVTPAPASPAAAVVPLAVRSTPRAPHTTRRRSQWRPRTGGRRRRAPRPLPEEAPSTGSEGRSRTQRARRGRPWQLALLKRLLRPGSLHGGGGRPGLVPGRIVSSAVCWRPSPYPFQLRPFQGLYPEPYAVQKAVLSLGLRPITSVLVPQPANHRAFSGPS